MFKIEETKNYLSLIRSSLSNLTNEKPSKKKRERRKKKRTCQEKLLLFHMGPYTMHTLNAQQQFYPPCKWQQTRTWLFQRKFQFRYLKFGQETEENECFAVFMPFEVWCYEDKQTWSVCWYFFSVSRSGRPSSLFCLETAVKQETTMKRIWKAQRVMRWVTLERPVKGQVMKRRIRERGRERERERKRERERRRERRRERERDKEGERAGGREGEGDWGERKREEETEKGGEGEGRKRQCKAQCGKLLTSSWMSNAAIDF